ncbi:MAG: NAD(P)/FAD-dependent oxidoreductase [Sulfolobales archaeon]
MSNNEYDVLIIGGGPAGYWASLIASIRGLKVVLAEERRVGGTCLNYGCVPLVTVMKYLSITNLIKKLSANDSGISFSGLRVDISKLFEYVNRGITTPISDSMKKTLEDLGVKIIYGKAILLNEHSAKVGNEQINFRKALIASGLDWYPIEGAIPCIDFTKVKEGLSKVLVIGANPFGLSVASLFGLSGCEVLVVEESSRILKGYDKEICEYLLMMLSENGINVMSNTKVGTVECNDRGKEVRLHSLEKESKVYVDEVIDAASYAPKLDVLGGVRLALNNSYIQVDEYLRTSIGNIYAAGDVTGISLYANSAIVQGIIAGENLAGSNLKINLRTLPKYVFTYPEAFSVGLTEDEAREAGYEVIVARQSLTSNPIMKSVGGAGVLKVIVDGKYGGVLGVHAVGHQITEIINEGILAVALESTCDSIIGTYLAHPTVGEVLRDSLLQVYKP